MRNINFFFMVRKMQKGCQGCLVSSIVASSVEPQEVDPSSVRLVKENLDIFLEELLELPP